jgi:chromosome partitioning protein
MRTIAIHTSKGGVGKTTLVVNIAYELARQGNRVLVIDLDDQANASLSLGVNKADEIEKVSSVKEFRKILDSFKDRKEVIDFLKMGTKDASIEECMICIYPASNWFHVESKEGGKIDVLPGSYQTSPENLPNSPTAPKFLDIQLQKLATEYDYVIMDTAPSYNLIAWNALYAAKYVIIPSQMEYLSAQGIKTTSKNILDVQLDTRKTRGNIFGIVPMMIDQPGRDTLNKMVEGFIKGSFPEIQILPKFNRSTYVAQASHKRMPLSLFAENNTSARTVAMQLIDLTDELVERIDSLEF